MPQPGTEPRRTTTVAEVVSLCASLKSEMLELLEVSEHAQSKHSRGQVELHCTPDEVRKMLVRLDHLRWQSGFFIDEFFGTSMWQRLQRRPLLTYLWGENFENLKTHLINARMALQNHLRKITIYKGKPDQDISKGMSQSDMHELGLRIRQDLYQLEQTVVYCPPDSPHLPWLSQSKPTDLPAFKTALALIRHHSPRLRGDDNHEFTEHLVDAMLRRHAEFMHSQKKSLPENISFKRFEEFHWPLGGGLPTALFCEMPTTSSLAEVPPMPLVPQDQAFCCPYCEEKIGFEHVWGHRTRHILDDPQSWHQHVLQDITPYACIFQPCIQHDFSNKRSWINHILYDHGNKDSQWSWITGQHHKTPLPSPEDPVYRCPFCEDFPDVDLSDYDEVERLPPFFDHVANHMERLALMTIPYYIMQPALPVTSNAIAGRSTAKTAPQVQRGPKR